MALVRSHSTSNWTYKSRKLPGQTQFERVLYIKDKKKNPLLTCVWSGTRLLKVCNIASGWVKAYVEHKVVSNYLIFIHTKASNCSTLFIRPFTINAMLSIQYGETAKQSKLWYHVATLWYPDLGTEAAKRAMRKNCFESYMQLHSFPRQHQVGLQR